MRIIRFGVRAFSLALATMACALELVAVSSAQTNFSPHIVASAATSGQAMKVRLGGNYAYVSWRKGFGDIRSGGLQVFDIRNPMMPVAIGAFSDNFEIFGLDVAGQIAFLAEGASLVLNQGRLNLLDVSQPATPSLIGTLKTGANPQSVRASGHYGYLSAGPFEVVDVTNPQFPLLTGRVATASAAVGIAVRDPYAYLATGDSGLEIIDVSSPTQPTVAGTLAIGGTSTSVQVTANVAYVANGDLVLIDVTDPSHPFEKGRFPMNGATDAQVAGSVAYVASGGDGLTIIDVTNPAQPIALQTVSTGGNASSVQVADGFAYLTDSVAGLVVIQIAPELVFNLPTRLGKSINVSWTGGPGARLQQSASLGGIVWQDVPNTSGTNAATLPATIGAGFFRLIKP